MLSTLYRSETDDSILRNTKVLFALTEEERALFFRDSDHAKTKAGEWVSEMRGITPEKWEKTLRQYSPEVIVSGWNTPRLPEDWISDPTCSLRYVCHLTGSVKGVVPRHFLTDRKGRVSNWGNLVGAVVAEHALLLALAALRNMPSWLPYIDTPIKQRPKGTIYCKPTSLIGKKVGLYGFGNVARSLVEFLKPFSVEIQAYSEGVPESMMREMGVERCNSLDSLMADKDALFLCESLTEITRRSITQKQLQLLPKGAVIINVARGGLVDEEALYRESIDGKVRLALDVVDGGTITGDHLFRNIPDAILSPHIGGPTLDFYPRLGAQVMENLRRYREKESLLGEVTLPIYERST